MNEISVFGSTGFIGSKWMEMYPDKSHAEERNSIKPTYDEIIYFRATNSNYNVYSDLSLDVNTNLTLLTETFKNIKPSSKITLISSWFVYGKNNIHVNLESSPCNPKGFYSITKYTQEQLLESFSKTFGINYRILRLCNVIGGDNKASAKKNALEHIIQKLKLNEDVEIYVGDNYRNYLHVEDVCKAINLIHTYGVIDSIYNVGSIESVKLIEIIDFCKTFLNSKSKLKLIHAPKFHQQVQTKDFHMDTTKLRNLGFEPKYTLEDALKNICSK